MGTSAADASAEKDRQPPRPAMPSGAVRARRTTRHRKGKGRTETMLEPAAPAPAPAPAPAFAPAPAPTEAEVKTRPKENIVETPNLRHPTESVQLQASHPGSSQKSQPSSQQTVLQVQQQRHRQASLRQAGQQPVAGTPLQADASHSVSPDMMAPPPVLRMHRPEHPASPRAQATVQLKPVLTMLYQQQTQQPVQLRQVRQVQALSQQDARGHHSRQQVVAHHNAQPQQLQAQHVEGHFQQEVFTQPTATTQLHRTVQEQVSAGVPQDDPSPATPQTPVALQSLSGIKQGCEHMQGHPQPLQAIQNHMNQHIVREGPSERLIVDISPQSQRSSAATEENDENASPNDASAACALADKEAAQLRELVACSASIKAPANATRPRPLICQDITNSNADTLRISRLPRGVTYDRILNMVEPFGEVEDLAWTASDPYVCDVTYREPAAAREAKHFLGDALVGNDSEPALKAELRSRDPGAQLFVGDLTPDVTEEMLEAAFSKLVGEPVSALLKRDPDSFSPIGYGFLSFKSESSANFALVAGHRTKVGNASVRVGRAERNTYLYVSDLAPEVSLEELKNVFGKFGTLVDEDTVVVRRSYAFIRYKNRGAAEKAKRTLDKTDLRGRLSVRYAEAEPLKACVAVQFHSSVPRPPNSLRDLLLATFSKHGNCSIEIPRLRNGMWRKVAFVTYHGEPITANLAALEAVQSVRFVSSLPVCCQFARELIPRLPSRGIRVEKLEETDADRAGAAALGAGGSTRGYTHKRSALRRMEQPTEQSTPSRQSQQNFKAAGRDLANESSLQQGSPDFVPVYVPVAALHPAQMPGSSAHGMDGDMSRYQQQWHNRMLMVNGNPSGLSLRPRGPPFGSNYNSFTPAQDRMMRW